MIIFIYGEDDFRAKNKIKELKDKFIREVDSTGSSLSVVDGSSASLREINTAIGPASLLSSKRMLVVENIFANKSKDILVEVLEYFKNKEEKNSEDIVIFYQEGIKSKKKGAKTEILKNDSAGREKALLVKEKKFFDFLIGQKFVQEFKKMSNTDIASWVKNEMQKRGATISIKAANELASLTDANLWQIDQEINKLINYKKGLLPKITEDNVSVQIEIEDVCLFVKGAYDENIFALTDAISARNKSLAIKLLEEEYEAGMSDSYLISMITRQIKILISIRQAIDCGMSSRDIASNLKLHPFVVQKGIGQVRNFDFETLRRFFNKLLVIDKDMKTGQGDAHTLLNILLSKI